MVRRIQLIVVSWAALALAVALLVTHPPEPDSLDLPAWLAFAGLIAVTAALGRGVGRRVATPISTPALLAYLALGTDSSTINAIWCVAAGAAAGFGLWMVRIWPALPLRGERMPLVRHLMLSVARTVLATFAGDVLYRELGGALPLTALGMDDLLPLAGLFGGFLAVSFGLLAVEWLASLRALRGPQQPEWPVWAVTILPPLPFAVLGAVIYHALSAEAFALLIGGMLLVIVAIRIATDALQRLQRQYEELLAFSYVNRAVSASLPLEELLQVVCEQAAILLNATECSAALVEPDGVTLRFPVTIRAGQPVAHPPRTMDHHLIDHVVRNRAPLLIADQVARRARTMQLDPPENPAASWLGVPLLAADRVAGALVAVSAHPARHFNADDVTLLTMLGAQVGIVAANARLGAQAQDRSQQLALLNNVAATLSGTLEVQPTLDLISASAMSVGGCDGVAIYLWPQGTTHELILVRKRGLSDDFAQTPPDPLILVANDLAHRRQPLTVNDVQTDRRARHLRALMRAAGKRAWIEFLLRKGDELIGVIAFYYDAPHAFSADEIELLRNFTNQAALALSNAQLYTQTHQALERRVEQLSALADISRELAAMLDLNKLFQLVLDRAAEATASQSGALLLRAYRRGAPPRLVASRGFDPAEFDPLSILVGAIAYTYRTGYPSRIPDTIHETEYIPLASGTRSQLNVPIVRGDDVLGVIVLGSERPGYYDEDDQAFVTQLATQARIAIENASLFQRIEVERDRLQIILDSMKEAVVLIDASGRITLANPRVNALLGVDPAAILNRPVEGLARDADLALAERFGFRQEAFVRLVTTLEEGTWEQTSQGSGRTGYELTAPRQRWIDRTVVPVRDAGGTAIGLLLVFSDVTHERELAQAREDLSRMIVHDLRGPLTAIATSLKLLGDFASGDDALGQAVVQTTEASSRAVRKLLNLVESLLDISKLEDGVMTLECEPVDLAGLCDAVLEEFMPLAEDLSVDLHAELPDDLPPLDADADKIERVLLNLVDNATKFVPMHGRVIVSASVDRAAGEGGRPIVRVQVEDNGPGIPDEAKERLFDRFAQLGSQRGRRRGTGLGLAFCKMAIEAHGGRIWIEDAPEGGARFVFTLPAVDVAAWALPDDENGALAF